MPDQLEVQISNETALHRLPLARLLLRCLRRQKSLPAFNVEDVRKIPANDQRRGACAELLDSDPETA